LGSERTKIKEVLTKEVVVVGPNSSLVNAMNLMNLRGISRLVVAEREGAVGIITKKDVFSFAASDDSGRPLDQVFVNEIMSQPLVTVNENEFVPVAASLMLDNEISSVIVSDKKNRMVGIVTKTDLVRFYMMKMTGRIKVKNIMSVPVVTVSPTNSIFYAAELMKKKKISRLVVVGGEAQIRGIVTFSDLFSTNPQLISIRMVDESSESQEIGIHISMGPALTVEDVMKTNVTSVSEEADVAYAAKLMLERKISGIPATNLPSTLSGIVTKNDICKVIARL
jgi:Predicted signal-transduction protein containing cAMP-binding and CBS domains